LPLEGGPWIGQGSQWHILWHPTMGIQIFKLWGIGIPWQFMHREMMIKYDIFVDSILLRFILIGW
jgi:hypothetical protein